MHNGIPTWHDLGGSGVDHKVVRIADFNGDGTSDVLWRNDTSGHVGIWEMHNNIPTWHDLGGSGADHKVVGVGDFNGDGTPIAIMSRAAAIIRKDISVLRHLEAGRAWPAG